MSPYVRCPRTRRPHATVVTLLASSIAVGAADADADGIGGTVPRDHRAPSLVRPVDGPLRTGFRYDRRVPFAPRQQRTVTLAARRRQPLRAACAGRVSYAGPTPQGTAVVVRCGGWAVTVLGGIPAVRRGQAVGAGTVVGRVDGPSIRLSLRRTDDRWGYVDPVPYLRAVKERRFAPLGPSPVRGGRRAPARLPRTARPGIRIAVPTTTPTVVGRPVRLPSGVAGGPLGAVAAATGPGPPGRGELGALGVGLAIAALGLPALGLPALGRRWSRPAAGSRRATAARLGAGTTVVEDR